MFSIEELKLISDLCDTELKHKKRGGLQAIGRVVPLAAKCGRLAQQLQQQQLDEAAKAEAAKAEAAKAEAAKAEAAKAEAAKAEAAKEPEAKPAYEEKPAKSNPKG